MEEEGREREEEKDGGPEWILGSSRGSDQPHTALPKVGHTGEFFSLLVGFCQFRPSSLTNAEAEVINNHFLQ